MNVCKANNEWDDEDDCDDDDDNKDNAVVDADVNADADDYDDADDDNIYIMMKCLYVMFLLILPSPCQADDIYI